MQKPKKNAHTEAIRDEARKYLLDHQDDDSNMDVVMVQPADAGPRHKFSPHILKTEVDAVMKKLGVPKEEAEPVHIGEGLWMCVIKVTPRRAALWLVEGNLSNRKITRSHSRRLITENAEGNWVLTPESLMFRKDGFTQDGQNRLYSVMHGGNAVLMVLSINVSDEARRVIDTGRARTTTEWFEFASGAVLSNVAKPTVRRAELGLDKGDFTSTQEGDLFYKYQDGLLFLFDPESGLFRRRYTNITNAGVMAAFLRAFYSVDKQVLARAAEILKSGDGASRKDQAMVKLWKQLIAGRTLPTRSQVGRYHITCQALSLFEQGDPGTTDQFRERSDEVYERPE